MKPVLRDTLRKRLHRHERGGDAEQADGSDAVSTLAAALPTNQDIIETVMMPRQQHLAPIGFYHLEHTAISKYAYARLACFATHADKPDRWQTAATQIPTLYCLGKCYDVPSDGAHNVRPYVGGHACQIMSLDSVLRDGVCNLPIYRRGGVALEEARQMASQALLNTMEAP